MTDFNYNVTIPGMGSTGSASDFSGDVPAAPGFGPIGPVMPSFPGNTPAAPGFGPIGPVMPSFPGNTPAAPGFGPIGPVTPSLPGNSNSSNSWNWGIISPVFTNVRGVAHVRFYNAAAIQEPLDIYMNNQLVVSNLDYTNCTDYLHVFPGTYLITVYRRTNPGFPIINTRVEFTRNNSYTVTILGTANNFSLQVIT